MHQVREVDKGNTGTSPHLAKQTAVEAEDKGMLIEFSTITDEMYSKIETETNGEGWNDFYRWLIVGQQSVAATPRVRPVAKREGGDGGGGRTW